MDIANWIVAAGTAGGAIASSWAAWAAVRGLNESKKYRMMSVKPIITFERTKEPFGQNFVGDYNSIQSATYTFLIKNTGLGPAVLGANPFGTEHHWDVEEIIHEIHQGKSLPERIIYPQSPLPNVLAPNDSYLLVVTLGCFSKVMETPWQFEFHYADINGSDLWTTVSIDPKTGNVVSLKLGPQEMYETPSWWKQIIEEARQM